MSLQRSVRKAFAIYNDASAVSKTIKTGNSKYVTNRAGRRVSYRLSNRLISMLFPPIRGRHHR